MTNEKKPENTLEKSAEKNYKDKNNSFLERIDKFFSNPIYYNSNIEKNDNYLKNKLNEIKYLDFQRTIF